VSPLVAARLRIGLLLALAILVQTTFGSDLRIVEVAPDLMIVLVICAGMTGGARAGAWVGFLAGLLADMFLVTTPVGLSAFTYCVVGASIGFLRESILHDRKILLPVAALLGTAFAVLLFVAAGDVFGQTQLLAGGRAWLIRVALVESLWSAVLVLPFSYVYTWAAKGSAGVDLVGTAGSADGGRGDRILGR
jgi:rod shape-determining protein MreD